MEATLLIWIKHILNHLVIKVEFIQGNWINIQLIPHIQLNLLRWELISNSQSMLSLSVEWFNNHYQITGSQFKMEDLKDINIEKRVHEIQKLNIDLKKVFIK